MFRRITAISVCCIAALLFYVAIHPTAQPDQPQSTPVTPITQPVLPPVVPAQTPPQL